MDLALFAQPGSGALRDDLVAVCSVPGPERPHVDHGALGHDLRTAALGEPEVVLGQRVLRADGAADHAAPAADAARARGPVAAEVRVGDRDALLAEEHADARLGVGLLRADVLAEAPQQLVGVVVGPDGRDAEHPLGLLVVRLERGLPVLLEARPLRVVVEALAGAVQGVRVAEAAAADARPADDRHVLEERQAEDPAQADPRREEVAPHVPGRLRELVVGEAPAGLEHPDAVALLGQPQGADAATEPRSHDDPIEVVRAVRRRHERQRTLNMTGASQLTRGSVIRLAGCFEQGRRLAVQAGPDRGRHDRLGRRRAQAQDGEGRASVARRGRIPARERVRSGAGVDVGARPAAARRSRGSRSPAPPRRTPRAAGRAAGSTSARRLPTPARRRRCADRARARVPGRRLASRRAGWPGRRRRR